MHKGTLIEQTRRIDGILRQEFLPSQNLVKGNWLRKK